MSTLTGTPVRPHSTRPARVTAGSFSWSQVRESLPGAVRKLDPRQQWHNPVMFIVWVGAVLTTALADHAGGWRVPTGARAVLDRAYLLFAVGLLADPYPEASAALAATLAAGSA